MIGMLLLIIMEFIYRISVLIEIFNYNFLIILCIHQIKKNIND